MNRYRELERQATVQDEARRNKEKQEEIMKNIKAQPGDMVLCSGVGGMVAVDHVHDEVEYGSMWLNVDKIDTTDPDEVIYWCSDEDGESYEVTGNDIDQVAVAQ